MTVDPTKPGLNIQRNANGQFVMGKETWQDYLNRLHLTSLGGNAPSNVIDALVAQSLMQTHYPGNYIVEEYYNSKQGKFTLRLKFESPPDETFFMLRWS